MQKKKKSAFKTHQYIVDNRKLLQQFFFQKNYLESNKKKKKKKRNVEFYQFFVMSILAPMCEVKISKIKKRIRYKQKCAYTYTDDLVLRHKVFPKPIKVFVLIYAQEKLFACKRKKKNTNSSLYSDKKYKKPSSVAKQKRQLSLQLQLLLLKKKKKKLNYLYYITLSIVRFGHNYISLTVIS